MMVVLREVASVGDMMLRVLGRQSNIQNPFEMFIQSFIYECTFEFCNPREHCASGLEQGELLSHWSRLDQCDARVYQETR